MAHPGYATTAPLQPHHRTPSASSDQYTTPGAQSPRRLSRISTTRPPSITTLGPPLGQSQSYPTIHQHNSTQYDLPRLNGHRSLSTNTNNIPTNYQSPSSPQSPAYLGLPSHRQDGRTHSNPEIYRTANNSSSVHLPPQPSHSRHQSTQSHSRHLTPDEIRARDEEEVSIH